MTPLTELLQHGAANAWLFIPSAILLGALHGLEPGHSKTMMAAFIIAIRGTVKQAVLLGVCATLSHTAVVWLIAVVGASLWHNLAPEAIEPYFQLASGVIIIAMSAWMLWSAWREQQAAHDHDHHHHDHHHDDEPHRIDTGHGVLTLEVFEDGVPPRFRLRPEGVKTAWRTEQLALETERPDGARQTFALVERGGYWESLEEIPEPHAFIARLTVEEGGHAHRFDVAFTEHDHDHAHDPMSEGLEGLDLTAGGYQDAHELAHATDIRRRFAGRSVTTAQIAIFGLTGGLVPCPGAITVLLLCLQFKQIALGAALVLCFSLGLALTMVMSGVIAALSVKHINQRWSGFGDIVRRAPYVSGALIFVVGVVIGVQGWLALN